jgi:hypothetical protein
MLQTNYVQTIYNFFFNYVIRHCVCRSSGRSMIHKKSKVEFHPLGVIGAIVSWNYPFHNIFNPMLAAVFSGNSIVIKVSYVQLPNIYSLSLLDALYFHNLTLLHRFSMALFFFFFSFLFFFFFFFFFFAFKFAHCYMYL